MPPTVTLWRFEAQDRAPLLWLVLLPVAVFLPQLAGWLNGNPILYFGQVATGLKGGIVSGLPYIDPNNGFTTQALGYRAALDWVQGQIPWWNPYSGVGLPLAAEYQPAAFFPFTFLLLLPRGTVLLQLALVVTAGIGTYALARQLGFTRFVSTMAGVLFAFNGTLAWFAHAPATAVPFLPWMILGVERARAKAALGMPGGWGILAAAMAMSLLAGFPETAYINGLLALAWAIMRGAQLARAHRLPYLARIAAGGTVGILVAAPQVVSFFQYLADSSWGGHDDRFAHEAHRLETAVPALIAPYAYGMVWGHSAGNLVIYQVWSAIGGYTTVLLVALAAYGLIARGGALAWVLAGWTLVGVGKSFGFAPAVAVVNLVPGITLAAFYRYAPPSWSLALILLAAMGLDALMRGRDPGKGAWLGATATAVALALLAFGLFAASDVAPLLEGQYRLRRAAMLAGAWALASVAFALWLLRRPGEQAARAVATLLVIEATLMFAAPTLSNPRSGHVDMNAINFLREGLGLQRFFTLGPIAPNYGARFGIASINHNYLPLARRWAEWVPSRLHRGLEDPVVFDGSHHESAAQLVENLPAYRGVGVKYVVTRPDDGPFAGEAAARLGARRVYRDEILSIFELEDFAPYFEPLSGACRVASAQRTRAVLDCEAPTQLVRRELFFPGWHATVNGREVPIAEHDALFQAVELPAGRSEVEFRYAPPHIGWAWLAAFAGLGVLSAGAFSRASAAFASPDRSARRAAPPPPPPAAAA